MSKNKKVWVLEDDRDIGEVIELLLTEEGYEVTLFETIFSFKNALSQFDADLFVMDVMLPDGNSLPVCENIKNDMDFKHVPIILMSASTKFAQVAHASPAEVFMPKPFDIDHFIGQVNKLVVSP